MHILIISRSYPNRLNSVSGNFVQNQVEALAAHSALKIGVAGVYNVSLKVLKNPANIGKYGFYKKQHGNVSEYTYLYPVIPKMHKLNHSNKFRIWKGLIKKYIAENGKPDIIHLHTFEPGDIAIWCKKEYDIPYIVTEHTSLFYRNIEKYWHTELAFKTYESSSYNIAVSKEACAFLEHKFKRKFHYLPNFVDTKRFDIGTNKGNIKHFINVAYLEPVKNQFMMIEAFHKAFHNDKNYELQIIGYGSEEERLNNLIKQLEATNIKLLGYVPQNEIVPYYQQANYFLLSSNIETFGLVIIEAMSCGLPVLSTDCEGPKSIIINDKLGKLSPVGDVDAYAQRLKELSKTDFDPLYIRQYTIDNFSYETLSDKLINIYRNFAG